MNVVKLTKKHLTKGFFSVDLDVFRHTASGGSLNETIAHLFMARGTGRDNRTTHWSANSIYQRTAISRRKSIKSVNGVVERGIWRKTREGRHPIYEVVPASQISGCRLSEKPVTVWLPNTLVDGATNEVPPVELIRQTRSLDALRLLVEMYAVQYLPDDGGVSRELLSIKFERVKVGEHRQFVVWGFRSTGTMTGHHKLAEQFLSGKKLSWKESFWPALHTLKAVGLVEKVEMLLDGADDDAEVIHPLGIHGGEPEERELARAADAAGQAMLTEGQADWAGGEGYQLVPVLEHITNVAVVGIFRLKYRPHTKYTGAWYALMQQSASEYLGYYLALAENPAAELQTGVVISRLRSRLSSRHTSRRGTTTYVQVEEESG